MTNYDAYRRMEREGYVCARCGVPVVCAWGGSFGRNEYILRCTQDVNHTGAFRPHIPDAYEEIDRRERQEMEKQSTAVAHPRVTALSQSRAREIINSLWPGAPEIEKTKAIMVCVDYGLNPLQKHLFLIPFNRRDKEGRTISTDWAMVYGIKAKRLIAYRRGAYNYADNTPRLMTEDEEKRAFGDHDASFISAITVVVDAAGNHYPGYGRWPVKDTPKGCEKGNSKANMAIIRSESQALERYAPGEMPPQADVIDAEYEELPPRQMVNKETGEIVEEEPKVVDSPLEAVRLAGAKSDEYPSWEELKSGAETKPFVSVLDVDWAVETIRNLVAKKVPDISRESLSKRFKEKYGIDVVFEKFSQLHDVLAKLDKDQATDFAKWLQEIENKVLTK